MGMFAVFMLYHKTRKRVKIRVSSMNNPVMKSTIAQTKALANTAVSISICTAVLLTPYVIGVIIIDVSKVYQVHNATTVAIFKWFTYLGSLANGVCSCIIFIAQNKPVKRLIKSLII